MLALTLATCAGDPAPVSPAACPATLAHLRPLLVTPPEQAAEFLGAAAMERTLNRPIDEMIERGGGFERSIEVGESYVREYQAILTRRDEVRAEYLAAGETGAWVDTYLSTVEDGVTINQGFVDAVRCRARQQAAG